MRGIESRKKMTNGGIKAKGQRFNLAILALDKLNGIA